MTTIKQIPDWLRVLNFLAGTIYILLSGFIILNAGLSDDILLFFLALISFLMGLVRIINGLFDEHLSQALKLLKIAVGVILVLLAIIVWLLPIFGINTFFILVTPLAIALLFHGAARITVGTADKVAPQWHRLLLLSAGALSIFIAFLVIIFASYDPSTLIFLVALGFLINGIVRIAVSISGFNIEEVNDI